MGPEDQHPWDREDEEIAQAFAAKDAEIERLRRDHQIVRNFLDAADAKLLKQEKLITELCDALEKWEAAKHWGWTQELLQRAREATR